MKVGHRVYIRSIKRRGVIEFIDKKHSKIPWMYPIQVRLERPYGECGQMIYRTSAGDLKRRKKI